MVTRKRVISTLVAGCLVSSLVLAGCGKTEAPAAKNPSANAGTAAQQTLPPVKLSWFTTGLEQKDQPLVLEEMNKYLKEKLNVTLSMTITDTSNYKQKKDLLIAGGDDVDVLFSGDWVGYNTDVAANAYADLTPLLEKYAPKTKAQVPQMYLDAVTINNKIWGVPATKDAATAYGFMLRKDLLDKYKLDISTIKKNEDMAAFFEVIKKNEPDIIPYVSAKSGCGTLMDAYKTDNGVRFDSKDYKVISNESVPEIVASLKLLRQWNEKGYINKDAATLQNATPLLKSGKVFAYFTSLKPGGDKDASANHGYPQIMVQTEPARITTASLSNSIQTISSRSKNPERAMMFIELLNTDKYLNNLINFGIENKHYVKVSDNIVDWPSGVDAKTSTYNQSAYAWTVGNQYINYVRKDEDPNKWENFKKFNETAMKSPLIGFTLDQTPIKAEQAALNAIGDTYNMGFRGGLFPDIDATLAEKAAKDKAAGLEKVLAERQKQIDAWVTSKKK